MEAVFIAYFLNVPVDGGTILRVIKKYQCSPESKLMSQTFPQTS